MPHADTLTVVHHDDTRTRYQDVRYELHRDGIRIWSEDGDVAGQQRLRQRVADRRLHQPAQRPGAVNGVVAPVAEPLHGRAGDLQAQSPVRDPVTQLAELDVHDR